MTEGAKRDLMLGNIYLYGQPCKLPVRRAGETILSRLPVTAKAPHPGPLSAGGEREKNGPSHSSLKP
jgi:hypothetical protein